MICDKDLASGEVFLLPSGPAEDDNIPDGMKNALLKALRVERPVTIGVIGVSGVGKSSLINRLFRTNFATSPTIACTKEFTAADVELSATKGPVAGTAIPLRVVDAPGLGESEESDPGYIKEYRRNLPDCDAIIWISAARNRAVALEQKYLSALQSFHPRMVFGLGQADLVDPLDWDERINLPSRKQEQHLEEISKDRAEKFSTVTGAQIAFIPFSAKRSYNLQLVFTSLVKRAERERGWLLSSIKGFQFDDWMTEEGRRIMGGVPTLGSVGRQSSRPKIGIRGLFAERSGRSDGNSPEESGQ